MFKVNSRIVSDTSSSNGETVVSTKKTKKISKETCDIERKPTTEQNPYEASLDEKAKFVLSIQSIYDNDDMTENVPPVVPDLSDSNESYVEFKSKKTPLFKWSPKKRKLSRPSRYTASRA